MAVEAKLVGMEVRDYKGQDGKQHTFCGLHLVHLEDSVRGVKGSKVESVSCPRDIDPEDVLQPVLLSAGDGSDPCGGNL